MSTTANSSPTASASTTSATANSAMLQVLGPHCIVELLEPVLLRLSPRDCLLAQRISRRWNEVINTSPAIGQKLCFGQGTSANIDFRDPWMDYDTGTEIEHMTPNPFFGMFFETTLDYTHYSDGEDQKDNEDERDGAQLRERPPPPEAAKPATPSSSQGPPGVNPSYNRMSLTWPPLRSVHWSSHLGPQICNEKVVFDDKTLGTFGGFLHKDYDYDRWAYEQLDAQIRPSPRHSKPSAPTASSSCSRASCCVYRLVIVCSRSGYHVDGTTLSTTLQPCARNCISGVALLLSLFGSLYLTIKSVSPLRNTLN
jgi:hypothetical protein